MEDKYRPPVIMDLNTPKNGDVKKENAVLLAEELDRLDEHQPINEEEVMCTNSRGRGAFISFICFF